MFASGANVAYAGSPETLKKDLQLARPDMLMSVPRIYERIYEGVRNKASTSTIKRAIFDWATDVGQQYARADEPGWWLRLKHWVADTLLFRKIRTAMGGNLSFCISGGGSLSADLAYLFEGMGVKVLEGYGLTESAPLVSVNPPQAPRIGTMGLPIVDVQTRLNKEPIPESEQQKVDGQLGELQIRGDNVTDGYYNKPDETDEAFTDDGWFCTGDIVEIDEDGYIKFRERLKQLLVLSTGKNIAPQPIEQHFSTSERVDQCMAIGDGEKFIALLVVPNFDNLRSWAGSEGIELPDKRSALCDHEQARQYIRDEIDRLNAKLGKNEQIREFELIPEEWTPENGLLTPSMKKKRRTIEQRYSDRVGRIYDQ